MNKYILLMILIGITNIVKSQSIDEIYENMPDNDRFSNMRSLLHYQENDPYRAISYYLLGNIYNEYMRETNPLLSYQSLKSHYHNLETCYSLIEFRLDKSQVRKDRELYNIKCPPDKKRIEKVDIVQEVNKKLEDARSYYQNAKTVHDSYVKCISKYNECLLFYRDILNRYPNYKTFYLQTTDNIEEKVEKLITDFDSTITYFDHYQKACENIPHLLKVKQYKIKPINTYRLEGLVDSDFEAPVVYLWDYKSWGENFLSIIDTDIKEIRSKLPVINEKLDKQTEKLVNQKTYSDEIQYYSPQPKFQNLISKYDYESVCNKIIYYKSSKIKWLSRIKSIINDTLNTDNFFLINKLRYYSALAEDLASLNNRLDEIEKSISLNDIDKYKTFFEEQYNGIDGTKRWCKLEKHKNKTIFNQNLKNIIAFINHDKYKYNVTDSTLRYRNKAIPFEISPLNKSQKFQTHNIVLFNKDCFLLNCSEIRSDSTNESFIAFVSNNSGVKWITKPESKTTHNMNTFIQNIEVADDNTFFVLWWDNNPQKPLGFSNEYFLSRYNSNGKLLTQNKLGNNFIPEYLQIDEIKETYLTISKKNNHKEHDSKLKIQSFTFNDSLLWERQFKTDGDFIDIIKTNNNFFVFMNCKKIQFENNKIINTDHLSLAGIYINPDGIIQQTTSLQAEKDIEISNVFKVTNNQFSFVGNTSNIEIFLLTDEYGSIQFSNIDSIQEEIIDFSEHH